MWEFQHSRCNLPTKITREKIAEKELVVRMIYRSRNGGFRFIWKNLPRHWNILNRQDVLEVWFSSFSFKIPRTLGEFDHNSPSQISEKSAILGEVLFNQTIFGGYHIRWTPQKSKRLLEANAEILLVSLRAIDLHKQNTGSIVEFWNGNWRNNVFSCWSFHHSAISTIRWLMWRWVLNPDEPILGILVGNQQPLTTNLFEAWKKQVEHHVYHKCRGIHGKTSPGTNLNQHRLLWRFINYVRHKKVS